MILFKGFNKKTIINVNCTTNNSVIQSCSTNVKHESIAPYYFLNKYNQVQPGKEIQKCVRKPLSTISYTKNKRQQQPCYKNIFMGFLHT